MAKVRSWKSSLDHYEALVAIECSRMSEFDKLIAVAFSRDLRTCPIVHVIGTNTMVVPRAAVRYLPLKTVKHTKVALLQCMFVSDTVNRELSRRFYSRDERKPNYFTTGRGRNRVCVRYLVPRAVVKEIEASQKH